MVCCLLLGQAPGVVSNVQTAQEVELFQGNGSQPDYYLYAITFNAPDCKSAVCHIATPSAPFEPEMDSGMIFFFLTDWREGDIERYQYGNFPRDQGFGVGCRVLSCQYAQGAAPLPYYGIDRVRGPITGCCVWYQMQHRILVWHHIKCSCRAKSQNTTPGSR